MPSRILLKPVMSLTSEGSGPSRSKGIAAGGWLLSSAVGSTTATMETSLMFSPDMKVLLFELGKANVLQDRQNGRNSESQRTRTIL